MTGDGIPDLVVMNDDFQVTVFINNGAGTFAAGVSYPTYVGFFSGGTVVARDIDGDLDLDLIVAAGAEAITLLFNAGNGTFPVSTTLIVDVASVMESVAAEDLNGDGDVDIVVATSNPFAGFDGLRLFSNDGAGNFALTESHKFEFPPADLVIVEVTGDTNPDIVVSIGFTDSFDVFIGDGTGSFTHPTNYLAQNGPGSLTTGDFNGDTETDVAVTSQADVVSVHLHE